MPPCEGRSAVSSRPTERDSSLRRVLNLMSAAVARAGCARGGGNEAGDQGSGGRLAECAPLAAGPFQIHEWSDGCEASLKPEDAPKHRVRLMLDERNFLSFIRAGQTIPTIRW